MRILISVSGKEEPGLFPMENSIPVRRKGEMYAGLWKFWFIMEPILLFLVEAHPHVGTDKLPGVIVNIRKTIQKQGGEIRFGCRVSDLIIRENSIQGVIAGGQEIASRHVILATGHSAGIFIGCCKGGGYGWSRKILPSDCV